VEHNGVQLREQSAAGIAPHIVIDPTVRFGRPIIQGPRLPVELVIAKLDGGMAPSEVAEEYGLTLEDVRAALSYAARVLAEETGVGREIPAPREGRGAISGDGARIAWPWVLGGLACRPSAG
jgi:uncharacterized protein (DUF433 family)